MKKWKREKMDYDRARQLSLFWRAHSMTLSPEMLRIVNLIINQIWSESPPLDRKPSTVFTGLDRFINTGYKSE